MAHWTTFRRSGSDPTDPGESWQVLERSAWDGLLAGLNATTGEDWQADRIRRLCRTALSFYPDCELVELWPAGAAHPAYYVHGPERAWRLDGAIETLYAINRALGLRFEFSAAPTAEEEARLYDYLRFFFAHQHDERGRHLLLESLEQVRWRYRTTDYDRERVATRILKPELEVFAHNGYADVRASLLRNDDLLAGHIAVSPAGKVSLQEVDTVLTGLPVVKDALNDLPAHSELFSLEAGWEPLGAVESEEIDAFRRQLLATPECPWPKDEDDRGEDDHRTEAVEAPAYACKRLSFLPDCLLVRPEDGASDCGFGLYFLLTPTGIHPLTGASQSIYLATDEHVLQLDSEEQIRDYALFFCLFVHGHGPFRIISLPSDLNVERAPVPRETPAGLSDVCCYDGLTPEELIAQIRAPAVHVAEGEGPHVVRACMQYEDSLYNTRLEIWPDGRVSMEKEQPFLNRLPIEDCEARNRIPFSRYGPSAIVTWQRPEAFPAILERAQEGLDHITGGRLNQFHGHEHMDAAEFAARVRRWAEGEGELPGPCVVDPAGEGDFVDLRELRCERAPIEALVFDRVYFRCPVDLTGAVLRGGLILRQCSVEGTLTLYDLTVQGILALRWAGIAGDLDLRKATLDALEIEGTVLARKNGEIRMFRRHDTDRSRSFWDDKEYVETGRTIIAGNLLSDGLFVDGSLSLADVWMIGDLNLHGTFIRPASIYNCVVLGDLNSDPGTRFHQHVQLRFLRLFGRFGLSDAQLDGNRIWSRAEHLRTRGVLSTQALRKAIERWIADPEAGLPAPCLVQPTTEVPTLNLSGLDIPRPLPLDRFCFQCPVELADLRVEGSLGFEHATFLEGLAAVGTRIEGALRMRGAWLSTEDCRHLAPTDCSTLDISGLHLEDGMDLGDGRVEGRLLGTSARLGGNLCMKQAHLFDEVQFEAAAIGGELDAGGIVIHGRLDLRECHVRGQARLTECRIYGDINIQSARFDTDFFIRSFPPAPGYVEGEIWGFHARIGGDLEIGSVFVTRRVVLENASLGRFLLTHKTATDGSKIRPAHIGGEIGLRHARIAGLMEVNSTVLDGPIQLDRAEVGTLELSMRPRPATETPTAAEEETPSAPPWFASPLAIRTWSLAGRLAGFAIAGLALYRLLVDTPWPRIDGSEALRHLLLLLAGLHIGHLFGRVRFAQGQRSAGRGSATESRPLALDVGPEEARLLAWLAFAGMLGFLWLAGHGLQHFLSDTRAQMPSLHRLGILWVSAWMAAWCLRVLHGLGLRFARRPENGHDDEQATADTPAFRKARELRLAFRDLVQVLSLGRLGTPTQPAPVPPEIVLNRARLHEFRISGRIPVMELGSAAIDHWTLDDQPPGERFLDILENGAEYERTTYTRIEQSLRNHGQREVAEQVHRAMRRQEQAREHRWAQTAAMLIHSLIGYGTKRAPVLRFMLLWFLFTGLWIAIEYPDVTRLEVETQTALIEAQGNDELAEQARTLRAEIDPEAGDPGWLARLARGFALALRYHVPVIGWDPWPYLMPQGQVMWAYTGFVTLAHWILWPLLLASLLQTLIPEREQ